MAAEDAHVQLVVDTERAEKARLAEIERREKFAFERFQSSHEDSRRSLWVPSVESVRKVQRARQLPPAYMLAHPESLLQNPLGVAYEPPISRAFLESMGVNRHTALESQKRSKGGRAQSATIKKRASLSKSSPMLDVSLDAWRTDSNAPESLASSPSRRRLQSAGPARTPLLLSTQAEGDHSFCFHFIAECSCD